MGIKEGIDVMNTGCYMQLMNNSTSETNYVLYVN